MLTLPPWTASTTSSLFMLQKERGKTIVRRGLARIQKVGTESPMSHYIYIYIIANGVLYSITIPVGTHAHPRWSADSEKLMKASTFVCLPKCNFQKTSHIIIYWQNLAKIIFCGCSRPGALRSHRLKPRFGGVLKSGCQHIPAELWTVVLRTSRSPSLEQ